MTKIKIPLPKWITDKHDDTPELRAHLQAFVEAVSRADKSIFTFEKVPNSHDLNSVKFSDYTGFSRAIVDTGDSIWMAKVRLTPHHVAELIPVLQYYVDTGRLPDHLPESNK